MEYRRLGQAGTKVSVLSLGGWTTFGGSVQEQEIADEIIVQAYEAGINFFDIADIYANGASEEMMGRVLQKFSRHTLVISSKVYWPMSDEINDRGLSASILWKALTNRSNVLAPNISIFTSAIAMTKTPRSKKRCAPWMI